MAGLGFKDFAVGEVLTSADVDGYLMQQTVMRFADSGARGSALGTAVLAEGMVSYLDDTNQVQVYNGSAWAVPGRILQVQQTVKTNTFSSTSAAYTNVTGLTVSITPSLSSSKILLVAQVSWSQSRTNDDAVAFRLNGGNADDYVGDAASNRTRGVFGPRFDGDRADMGQQVAAYSIVYLDSPATTSATTYAVQMQVAQGTGYVNRSGSDTDSDKFVRGASSITAIEVVA